jgi:allantoinase
MSQAITPPSQRRLALHDRYSFSPITQRPDYAWPDGNRLAVYVGFNVENFEFGRGLGAKLAPSNELDVLNYAWRDYGNRVGVWRCFDLFSELDIKVGALINTSLYDDCPQITDAIRARGDEIIGHGHTNAEHQGGLSETGERLLIAGCAARIAAEEGKPPRGWLSPWIAESAVTPDLMQECGYQYTLNWCHDDQPMPMKTRQGVLWSVPYPQELNDIPMLVGRQLDMLAFSQMIEDQFDEMLRQSAHQPLVMGIALHPYLIGHPYRMKALRTALQRIRARGNAWWTTPGAIHDHVQGIDAVRALAAKP